MGSGRMYLDLRFISEGANELSRVTTITVKKSTRKNGVGRRGFAVSNANSEAENP